MYLNLVHDPIHHNIKILPKSIKDAVIKELEQVPKEMVGAWGHIPGVINFMKNGESSSEKFKKFLEFTKVSDEYRKQDFKDVFKEYATHIFL
jgi:hypothetical protein